MQSAKEARQSQRQSQLQSALEGASAETAARLRELCAEHAGKDAGDISGIAYGTRAGLLLWASDGIGALAGVDLAGATPKPVGRLLDAAGIDPSVVDFVRQHFEAGQRCELVVSLSQDESAPEIHLVVEPHAIAPGGEAEEFVAIATAVPKPTNAPAHRADTQESTSHKRAPSREELRAQCSAALTKLGSAQTLATPTAFDWSAMVLRAFERALASCPPKLTLDVALANDLPHALADEALIETVLEQLFGAAILRLHDVWGTLSVTTGILPARTAMVSTVYTRAHPAIAGQSGAMLFAEIHDTAAISRRADADTAAQAAEGLARAATRLHGGHVLGDRCIGSGTQWVVLVPVDGASTRSSLR